MKTKPKLLKTRIIFPVLALALFLLGGAIYMICEGRSNTVYLMVSSEEFIPGSAKAEIEGDGVIEVDSLKEEPYEDQFLLTVVTKSAGKGRGKDTLHLKFDVRKNPIEDGSVDDEPYPVDTTYRLRTLPFGVVYDKTLDTFDGIECLLVMLAGIMLITGIAMILSVIEKYRAGAFSYAMVVRCGLIIYLFTCTFILVNEWRHHIKFSLSMSTNDYIMILFDTGRLFVKLTVIPLFLLAFALSVSNIRLVRKEGFRPANLLGILLGVALIGGIWTVFRLNSTVYYDNDLMYHLFTLISIAFAFVFCYFECMLLSTMLCAVLSTRYKPPYDLDYIIILGCAIRSDGTPTPLLRGRIDRAVEFEREQFAKTGKHAGFVPSGGQGSNEIISEAQSMKDYLLTQGIPEEQIVLENKSVNTYQNMLFSKKVIENEEKDIEGVNIGFSTTNYHVFRGYTLANKIKMKVSGLSAKTKLYFFPNAFIREFIGLLWEQRLRHLLFVFCLVLWLSGIYFFKVSYLYI